MSFDLSELLKSIGPSATIIFAAWIFMGFLQQRYDAAVGRYRAIVETYRSDSLPEHRRRHTRELILSYNRSCKLMNYTFQVGLISATLLLLSLIAAEAGTIVPRLSAFKYISAGAMLAGFVLVIVSAVLVMLDSVMSHRQVEEELLDVPDLARGSGHKT